MEKVPKVILSAWKDYRKLYCPLGEEEKKKRKLYFPLGKSTESYPFHLGKVPKAILSTWRKNTESYTLHSGKEPKVILSSWRKVTFHLGKAPKVILSTSEKNRKLYFLLGGKSTESHNFHLGKAPKVILLASEWESTERLPLLMNGMRQSSNQALSLVDSIKCRQIGGKWCSFVGDLNWTLLTRPAVSWTKVIRKIAVELEICVRELLVLARQPHG